MTNRPATRLRRLEFYAYFGVALVKARLGVLRAPFKYILVVTKRCNSRCRNCFIWTEKVKGELTLEEYAQIAKQSPQLLWLNLTGGEVTLRNDLLEIVRVFKTECPRLGILNFTTNGLDPEKIFATVTALRELGFIKFVVNVSLDGPSETHDELRGVRGNFRSAIQTFKKLRSLNDVESLFSFTIYDANYDKFQHMLDEVRRDVPSISKEDFHLNLENRSAHFYRNAKSNTTGRATGDVTGHEMAQTLAETATTEAKIALLKSFASFGSIFLRPMTYFKKRYHRLAIQFMNSRKTPIACRALRSSVYISEHGAVYPCVAWDKKVGDLRESAFRVAPILNSDIAIQTKKKIELKHCPNCWTPCEAYHSMLVSPIGT